MGQLFGMNNMKVMSKCQIICCIILFLCLYHGACFFSEKTIDLYMHMNFPGYSKLLLFLFVFAYLGKIRSI